MRRGAGQGLQGQDGPRRRDAEGRLARSLARQPGDPRRQPRSSRASAPSGRCIWRSSTSARATSPGARCCAATCPSASRRRARARASITRAPRRSASSGRSPRSLARPLRPRPKSASRRASRRTSAPSASIRRASFCISAATSRPSPRRRCARPWRRCFCANAGSTAASPSSIRCAGRARSSSKRRRSPPGLSPGRSRRFAFEQLATFDAAAWQRMREAHERRDARRCAFTAATSTRARSA